MARIAGVNIPTAKRVSECVAHVLVAHAARELTKPARSGTRKRKRARKR